jgi:hypothetical protein
MQSSCWMIFNLNNLVNITTSEVQNKGYSSKYCVYILTFPLLYPAFEPFPSDFYSFFIPLYPYHSLSPRAYGPLFSLPFTHRPIIWFLEESVDDTERCVIYQK